MERAVSIHEMGSLPAILLRQAWTFLDEGRPDDARISATAVFNSLDDHERELRFECHLILLRALQALQESELAIEHGLALVVLADSLNRNSLRSTAHSDLAAVYGAAGLPDLAVTHLQESLRFARVRSSHQLSTPFYRLGSVYLELGQASEALSCLETARKGFLFLQQQEDVIAALLGEGRALLLLNRTNEALRHLMWALTLIEKTGHLAEQPTTYRWLAEAYAQAGKQEQARRNFQKAIDLHRAGTSVDQEPDNRLAYANYLLKAGQQTSALAQLEIALQLFRASKREEQEAQVLRLQGKVLEEIGDASSAYEKLKAYVQLRNQLDASRGEQRATVQILQLEQSLRKSTSPPYVTNQVLAKENRFLRERAQQLNQLSNMDHLTGLHNRRYLTQRLEDLLNKCDEGFQASMMLIDIDDFKRVNDTFTHTVGDAVLVELSALFMQEFRSWDIIGRWGGEEFLVLLPGSQPEEARVVAEKVRLTIERHDWEPLTGELPVTVSIGLVPLTASFPPRLEDALIAAGEKLKVAKTTGKNRVVAG